MGEEESDVGSLTMVLSKVNKISVRCCTVSAGERTRK